MRVFVTMLATATTLWGLAAIAAPPTASEREALLEKLATFQATADRDPRAGCNAGWIQFQLGRLNEARGALDRAITQLEAETPRKGQLLGACLYNRGRVHEAEGAPDRARTDYQGSLAVRPNGTVEARLRSLGPGLPKTWRSDRETGGEPLPPSLRAVEQDSRCAKGASTRGQRCQFDRVLSAASADGGLTASVLRQRVEHRTVGEVVLYLAVETRKGAVVYTERPLSDFVPSPPVGYHTVELAMGGHADKLGPLVILTLKASRHDVEGGSRHLGVDLHIVIATDSSGAPIARVLQTVWDEMVDDDEAAGSAWSLAVSHRNDGKAVVTKKQGRLPSELAPLLGTHPTRELGHSIADYTDPLAQ